jgi:hypothetical protein
MYKNHVISTSDELLTSGFRPANRPDHTGCDFVDSKGQCNTPRGVDILAFADGKVVEVIKGSLVGNTVTIAHEGKILTRYQHMRDGVKVKVGDTVKKGQIIGVMGNTGYCTSSNKSVPPEYRGTHLHFGVKENSTAYNNGVWVDPLPYLNGEKAVAGRSANTAVPAQSAPKTSVSPAVSTGPELKVGDRVKVLNAVTYDDGKPFRLWHSVYTVMQVRDGRIVIGADGVTTAAVSAKHLQRV